VVAWGKVRRFAIHFRRSDVRRVESFMAVALVIVIALLAVVILVYFLGARSQTDRLITWSVCAMFVFILGAFLVHPVLSLGILVNVNQSSWRDTVTEEAWRLQEAVETAKTDGARASTLRAAKLCAALSMLLSGSDATMRILGLPVTPALLNSVAVSLAAAGTAWVAEIVRSEE
jgi:small-conductance mechanosensitive channel